MEKFTRGLLCAALATTLVACSNSTTAPEAHASKTIMLADFNSPTDGLQISTEGGAEFTRLESGELTVTFSPVEKFSKLILQPSTPWDLSGRPELNLAMDVQNMSEESIQLYIGFKNAQGRATNHSVNVAAGSTKTVYVLLAGHAAKVDLGFKHSRMPAWESDDALAFFRYGDDLLDLSALSEISLSVRGNLTPKHIRVDNIRARTNPDYPSDFHKGYVDAWGQNAKVDFPGKIQSDEQLKAAADAELAALSKSGLMPDRSRFGGWKDGPRLEATGYFRREKVDGKWWLVDPDGYLFFSHGLANVRLANLSTTTGIDFKDDSVRYVDPDAVTPEDSMGMVKVSDAVRATRYVASELRHNAFTWLPGYDDPLADHYSYRRSVFLGPVKSGETYSFYRANLERRYGETEPESYMRTWEQVTLDRFNDWGFTSMGNWVDPAFYTNEQVPYFANGWIIGNFKTLTSEVSYWADMPDAFDPEFVRRAQVTIDVIAEEIQSSPWCVGIFVDNEKSWGLREGTISQRYGLILDALSKTTADSPAKAAFVTALKQKYPTIEALNEAWGTELSGWAALSESQTFDAFPEAFVADLSMMLEMLSDQYFRVVHDALEKTLPNHLYMGVRMASWGMPDETIKASVKYSDVLSFNVYEEGLQPKLWSFLDEIDLPAVIGEFHIGATSDTGLYHPGLVQAANQQDRAQMYLAYMESILANKNLVGAHWFQYVDSPISGRAFDGENYNVGFVSATDIPYPDMVKATKAFNASVYPKRYKLGRK
ncbi:agarase [Simiduia agarivorans]|uniref:Agarase n=1 Tax=Simiduia agarivorans (strain DSM 21679 / JCM 13881 / BCRC 17597 / SA1) TaxID=1117647 RepID=K4KMY3_SIMAS|nr:agarase [Simiduia agarivorans]AFV00535.1 agarase [Simiduia agarivorans SA1 = DSM 21679]